MKCEKCGKEIQRIMVNEFLPDGSDCDMPRHYKEWDEDGVVSIDTHEHWTGYELTEEEQLDTIFCPHCKQFPFEDDHIQVYNVVRIVCFKK